MFFLLFINNVCRFALELKASIQMVKKEAVKKEWKQTGIKFETNLLTSLKQRAKDEGRNISRLVDDLIRAGLKTEK